MDTARPKVSTERGAACCSSAGGSASLPPLTAIGFCTARSPGHACEMLVSLPAGGDAGAGADAIGRHDVVRAGWQARAVHAIAELDMGVALRILTVMNTCALGPWP